MTRSLRIVDDEEVRGVLDLDRAYDAVREAYLEAAANPPVLSTPPALLMRHPSAPALASKVKGAQSPALGVAGFRIVTDHEGPDGEVSHDFQWLTDLATGAPIGLVEMNTLHAVRTALTGVIALEALRGPSCPVVAVLGAGRIAGHLVGILRARLQPNLIRVAGSGPGRACAFAAHHGAPVVAVDTVAQALDGADAVIAITSAGAPIVHAGMLRPGMTVVGMGGGHECDVSVLHWADRFVVDDLAFALVSGSLGAWVRTGGTDAATAHGLLSGSLGAVLAGTRAGRHRPGENVFAIVQGMACCDLALASMVWAAARPTM